MTSLSPPSLNERRLKSNNHRSCSLSEESREEVIVREDDALLRVTVLVSSFSFDKVLNVEISKIIISIINKKAPMNIIICSPQGNVHRTTQANISLSIISRLSKVSYSSFLISLNNYKR